MRRDKTPDAMYKLGGVLVKEKAAGAKDGHGLAGIDVSAHG